MLFTVFGVELQAASLADILRSKQATNRPQDRRDVIVLKEMVHVARSANAAAGQHG